MPVKKNLQDLPAAESGVRPVKQTMILDRLVSGWYAEYLEGRGGPRERAMPELPIRASELASRCDRQAWYKLAGVEESDPADEATMWRFRAGQLVHDMIDAQIVKLPGWSIEETVDLRPAGIPGSAHGDAVHRTDGVIDVVAEFKSVGGFAFKQAATKFKGAPQGPKWEAILQAAVSAVALGAPTILVLNVSLENASRQIAAKENLTPREMFSAEWHFATDDWRDTVALEANRQARLLRHVERKLRPERTLSDPDSHAGAFVSDPTKGSWLVANADGSVRHSGKTWRCEYCPFQRQCLDDGPGAQMPATTTEEY